MKLSRLIARSLLFYWRTGLVVALGVAVATAVITGSLLVGDSVTGSVRDAALARLGRIDHALAAPAFFREELGRDIAGDPRLSGRLRRVVSAIITTGAAHEPGSGVTVANVSVMGVGEEFWQLFTRAERGRPGAPAPRGRRLTGRDVAINEALARDLGVGAGDDVLINVRRRGKAPADTLFARRGRRDVLSSMRLKVVGVLPGFGAGCFALGNQTSLPRNAFISKEWLARQLGRQNYANALLVESSAVHREQNDRPLQSALAPACTASDYGLKLVPNDRQGYLAVQSETLVLADDRAEAIRRAAAACGARSAVTSVYLANSILKAGGRSIAYAVIAGVEPLEPLPIREGGLQGLDGDGIVLNTWAAADLDAKVGDELQVGHLVPSRDGVYRTRTIRFTLCGIVELEGPAADRALVPEFEGITEADSVSDWDPPFPIDLKRVTDRDEEYWDRFRATPKAFVSLDAMRSIWSSGAQRAGAGWVTSVRLVPPPGKTLAAFEEEFEAALKERLPTAAGMVFRPLRRQALEASKGTQDYGVLFVSMSMFLVAAAMGLAGMLMRLSTQRRAAQAGTLLACGFTNHAAMLCVMAEGAALALVGAAAGVPLAIAYARGIIFLLSAGRLGSIGNASLWLHLNAGTLLAGAGCGLAAGLVSIWWGTRSLGRSKVLDLLAGWQAMNVLPASSHRGAAEALLAASLVSTGVLLAFVRGTGAFFGSGAALLLAGLCGAYLLLAGVRQGRSSVSMAKLTLRSAAANRGRSMLVVGLLACASFVITAVAAHTRDYSRADVTRLDSGTGGFSLRGVSSIPIPYDFGTATGREKLGFPPEDEALFHGAEVLSFLSNSGDDISCLNLARPMAPRVLGVGRRMIERGGFRVSTASRTAGDPWRLLEQPGEEGAIPVFGDADSVRWQLHSGLGKTITMPGPDGRPVRLRVVGTIGGSIFAGELLMSEQNFRRTFPGEDTPRYFLIETPPSVAGQTAQALRRNLGAMGLEVRSTREILNSIIGVQNTYISTFVALGGLGVVLGTFGLVIVVLRGALERRGEFALMLATGFNRRFLAAMLITENGGLLCAGLLCGAVSALVAVAPELSSAESQANWPALGGLLAGIVAIGLASCGVAARAAARGSLIEALREE